MANPNDAFDGMAEAFEAMIDWQKRLGNEAPLYRWLVDQFQVKRVLDAACGTGHHANMLHSLGLDVWGADISGAMIQRCRNSFGENDRQHWAVRGFDQPVPQPAGFDLVMCVGNSLALGGDLPAITMAIGNLYSAVRPGGALLIHVLNPWRLADGICQWGTCKRAKLSAGEHLILKGVHRAGTRLFVDMLVTQLDVDPPKLRQECVPLTGLRSEELEQAVKAAGARQVQFFGDYQRTPYQADTSVDLIMVAI